MSAQPAPPSVPDSPPDGSPHAPQDYAAVLDDIINVGAHLVRDLRDMPRDIGQDVARDYDLLTRSIRRSILLSRKLAEVPEPARPQANVRDPVAHRTAARKRIIREVEDAIGRRAREPDADNLRAELLERLDSPDLEDDIETRPVPEIIAELCRDLGLAASFEPSLWKRRTPHDVQALLALAAKPAEPPAAEPPRASHPAAPLPNLPDDYFHDDCVPDDCLADDRFPEDDAPDDPAAAVATILRYEALARDQR